MRLVVRGRDIADAIFGDEAGDFLEAARLGPLVGIEHRHGAATLARHHLHGGDVGVAVDLAQRIFGQLSNCKVLVLGAGETSERTARALASRGVKDLRVSNRSSDHARELARLVGGQAVPFDQWPEQSREIDILITSTSSETPLLTSENLAPMLRDRIDRPLFIIDIAVPRDVDPDVNEMEGVYLYDLDSLQSVADQSLALRRQQIAAAEAIIAEHVADFVDSIARGLNSVAQAAEHPPVADGSLRASEL